MLNIVYFSCSVTFTIILLEKFGFFRKIENDLFQTTPLGIKINYTEICYFCWCFWFSLSHVLVATYLRNLFFGDTFYMVIAVTVLSRYLTVQILRK